MTVVDRLAEAKQEACDAAELVAALEQRVVDGDDTVSPEELAARKSLAEFAALRVKAAKRKQAQASQEMTEAEIDALGEEALAHIKLGATKLHAASEKAYEALLEVYAIAAERDQRQASLARRVQEAAAHHPAELRQRTAIRDLVVGHNFSHGFAVETPGGERRELRRVAAVHSIFAVAAAALDASVALGGHDRQDLHLGLVLAAAGATAELPELAPRPDWRKSF